MLSPPYFFSIIIPTYGRRDVVVRSLEALAGLEQPWPCEVIVVVDGSQDGTVEAADAVQLPFPKRVVYQDNAGAATARNRGVVESRGDILLFLDDDMVADPRLLVEHARLLEEGADAVVGHIPLHPNSPSTVLTRGVVEWTTHRLARLRESSGGVRLRDLLTGQLSVRADVFADVGGFDTDFNRGGSFGAEDTDFLYRLISSGARVRAAPDAISYQQYVVTPDRLLQQWRQAGESDAALSRKHPQLGRQLLDQHDHNLVIRSLIRLFMALPSRVSDAVERSVVADAASTSPRRSTATLFNGIRVARYWTGAREGGGIIAADVGGISVLAYHAIEDVGHPVTRRYAVPPEEFEAQIRAIVAAGFHFVGAEQFLAHLNGVPAPARSVLLTFDDGYASVAASAAPLLDSLGIPAVMFLVTAQVGQTNVWDDHTGASPLPLMDRRAAQSLAHRGWEMGAHSRTHAHLIGLDPLQLDSEIVGAAEDLEDLKLPAPRMFAYPYGEHSHRARAAVRRAGYRAGFALTEGASTADRFAYPRIEVQRGTAPDDLVERLLAAPCRRRLLGTPGFDTLVRQARREVRGVLASLRRGGGQSG
jgi:peptidoglycan/xylan/chitin deacetylase (PgdA/CDA1 family)/GT2 family glycosyltransferase